MPATLEYLRPTTIDEALAQLRRPGLRTVPLAGGTWLVPRLRRDLDVPDPLDDPVDAVVDLAGLELNAIEWEGEPGNGWLHMGATVTLQQIAHSPICREVAGGILAEAAHREAPINQRNAATVAGVMLASPSQSELQLELLVLAAHVVINDGQPRLVPLAELLADPTGQLTGALVTAVKMPWPAETVRGGLARVARTPSDYPIVAAAAAVDGESQRLAIGGVTAAPLLLSLSSGDGLEKALAAALAGADLLADWQGSGEYRHTMGVVLGQRALAMGVVPQGQAAS